MAVRTCSAQRRRVRRRHPRRTRVETYARAKIQQQHFGSPSSIAIRSRPMGHERQTRHDSRRRFSACSTIENAFPIASVRSNIDNAPVAEPPEPHGALTCLAASRRSRSDNSGSVTSLAKVAGVLDPASLCGRHRPSERDFRRRRQDHRRGDRQAADDLREFVALHSNAFKPGTAAPSARAKI
jgi:hypothetical protein